MDALHTGMEFRDTVTVTDANGCTATAERTSVRTLNRLRSSWLVSAPEWIGRVKLGQPVPLLYLSFELKRGSPETMSTYRPSCLLSQYSFWKERSVPSSWVT